MNAVEQQDLLEKLEKELVRCRFWIESALAYSGGTHSYEDICAGIMSGHMQLWSGESGCAVTEITVYPKRKFLHVFLAGGDMDQILDFEKSAEIFAKECGCDGMTLAGRKGWARVHRDRGWEEQFVTLKKEF